MTIDKEKVFNTVDDWVFNKYGNHILLENGDVDMKAIISLFQQQNGEEKEIIEAIPEDIVLDVSESEDGNEDNICLHLDEKQLIMYVPKELRDKIQFEIEYILSGFDKIQNAVADLTQEFQNNRKGALVNAEKELRNCGNEFTKESRQIIIGCINDVGSSIEQTRESIVSLCNTIDKIPLDRKKRLFKTPINIVLSDVKRGRMSVYDYIYGSAIYAELNMKIGRKNAAIARLQETIDFLKDMCNKNRFIRVEQWNEKKDMFWEDGIKEQIDVLQRELEQIKNYSGKYAFIEGEII